MFTLPDTPSQPINLGQSTFDLYAVIEALKQQVSADGDQIFRGWKQAVTRPEFLPSARNLAHYLAFRKSDVRELQQRLAWFGLSSLGRCEPHVMASLDAVLASLSAVNGAPQREYPPEDDFLIGRKTLLKRKNQLFGDDPDGASTRIMVTLPSEAATDAALTAQLIAAGANCVRVNCAHDTPEAWEKMIHHVREAAAQQRRDVRVLMDLGGPKIRIAAVSGNDKVRLHAGESFALVPAFTGQFDIPEAIVSHPEILAGLAVGSSISVDDGKIAATVVERNSARTIFKVTRAKEKGSRLKAEKGLNVPGAELAIPALTPDDLKDLDFVADHADAVGFSFVQTPEDVRSLISELRKRRVSRRLPAVILKVETALAVRNLPRLIVQAGAELPVAVMIARGDLAVEIGLERLSEIQEEILWLCEAASVPVVWATQVLEGMVKEGMATRAETTDAAMSQRAECVMLNKGPHLVEAVQFLHGILIRMDRHQQKKIALLPQLRSWNGPQLL